MVSVAIICVNVVFSIFVIAFSCTCILLPSVVVVFLNYVDIVVSILLVASGCICQLFLCLELLRLVLRECFRYV